MARRAIERGEQFGAAGAHDAGEADDLAGAHDEAHVLGRLPAGPRGPGAKAGVIQPQHRLAERCRALGIELVERAPNEEAHELRLRRVGGLHARDLPVAHDGDAIGDARHFLEPVRNIDDADAARGDLAHDDEKPLHFGGGERRRRLVHDEDLRCVGQRLGDGDDLPASDRKLAHGLVDADVLADDAEPLDRLPAHRRAVENPAAGELAPEEQIGGDVQARHEVELLENRRHARGLGGARIVEADGLAVEQHLAGVRGKDAGENVHQRRLAGAVLTEQRMNLAPLEVEIDAAQSLDAAEMLGDAAHDEQRGGGFGGPAHRGLAQESRSLSAASSRTVRRAPSGAAIRSIKRNAALRPISSQGCATRVKRGSKQSAHSKSSKPAIEMSAGTLKPRARTARIAPIVAILLPVTIAVGGSGSDMSA